jgi:formylglycine-generating enzyme required for sulfatase activity/serine/threonine protein kinase
MADVLAGLDLTLGREVAVKLIRGQADERTLHKFVLEARITGQLEHPSIVPAYELGQTTDGRLYLTMKKVVGYELAGLIASVRRERLEPQNSTTGDNHGASRQAARRTAAARRAKHTHPLGTAPTQPALGGRADLPHGLLKLLQVFLKVCDGVAFAHSKGVIHRDLKPANVMVGDFGEVLVMDWGLAKILGQDIDADWGCTGLLPNLSRSRQEALQSLDGQIMGTPAYMPPEQAAGRITELDQRADVYALGAILYELLTLAPPYEGESAWHILDQVTTGPPIAPSERVEGAWAVPWELEGVVLRAMAQRRRDRYPNVPALAADVEAFLAGRTVSAVSYTRWQLTSKFLKRHGRSVSAAAVALLSLIAALVYGVLSARHTAAVTAQALAQVLREQKATDAARQRAEAQEHEAQLERTKALDKEREARANLETARQLGALKKLQALQRRFERELYWTPWVWDGDLPRGDLAHRPTRPRLQEALTAIEDWDQELQALRERRPVFAAAREAVADPAAALNADEHDWRQLQRDSYEQILRELDELDSLKSATLAQHQAYQTILARKVDEHAWAAAAARIAANPRYREGLVLGERQALTAQLGLVPLGTDPYSGLEEFAHLDSGQPVERNDDGNLAFSEHSGIVFVLIPAGRYRIGANVTMDANASPEEGPPHDVQLDAFFLAKTELTQAQWIALGGTNTSNWRAGQTYGPVRVTLRHPVEKVSWVDCVLVLGRHGMQLPTERQWEAAARGNTTTPLWTGSMPETLADAENIADVQARNMSGIGHTEAHDDGQIITAAVGSYPRVHPFGLLDIAGNVREWCMDEFAPYGSPTLDRQGWQPPTTRSTERLNSLRGGSWNASAVSARMSYRYGISPAVRGHAIGCRPSRSITFSPVPPQER